MKQDAETYRRKSVHAAAEQVLSQAWGQPVRLSEPEGVWVYPDECRPTIQRAAVLDGPAGAPATVIIKRINWPDPWDSEDVRPLRDGGGDATPAWRLIGEWVGTQFLGSLPHDPPLSPRCYGGDREEGFVILEDIGTGERVIDLLMGDDPIRAEAALLAYATTLGRIHALTSGREAEYDRLWNALHPRDVKNRTMEAGLFRQNWCAVQSAGDAVDLEWPRDIQADVDRVVWAVENPGPFNALTMGDPNPANDMVANGHVRLYDLERSAFRHALFDGFMTRHLLPWRRHRLPAALERRFESVYRGELARGCPEAADDTAYRHASLEMRAAWLLRLSAWFMETALDHDGYWEDELSEEERAIRPPIRWRTLQILEEFADEAEAVAHLPALGSAARRLAARLRTLWRPAPFELPLFPAFQAFRRSGVRGSDPTPPEHLNA